MTELRQCFGLSNDSNVSIVREEGTLEKLDYWLTGPLLAIIIIFGVLGNITSAYVFYQSLRTYKIYLFLFVLAWWDVALVVGTLFVFGVPTLLYGKVVLHGEYAPVFPFVYFFCNVARNGSVWIVLVIAVERYFALCHPYEFESLNTKNRTYAILTSVSCSAIIYGIPRFFELRLSHCMNPLTLEAVPEVVPWLRLNNFYWLVYRVTGGLMFYSLGPFLILTLLTIRISVEIHRGVPVTPRTTSRRESSLLMALRHRHGSKHSVKHDPNNNESINHWMHVAVISKFLVCHSLPTILDVYELFDNVFLRTEAGAVLGHASNLLVVFNSSCNFFIYLTTSAHFKRDLRQCGRRKSKYNRANSDDVYSMS